MYWINFQNKCQKTLLHTLLLLVFKIIENFQCILNLIIFIFSVYASFPDWLIRMKARQITPCLNFPRQKNTHSRDKFCIKNVFSSCEFVYTFIHLRFTPKLPYPLLEKLCLPFTLQEWLLTTVVIFDKKYRKKNINIEVKVWI